MPHPGRHMACTGLDLILITLCPTQVWSHIYSRDQLNVAPEEHPVSRPWSSFDETRIGGVVVDLNRFPQVHYRSLMASRSHVVSCCAPSPWYTAGAADRGSAEPAPEPGEGGGGVLRDLQRAGLLHGATGPCMCCPMNVVEPSGDRNRRIGTSVLLGRPPPSPLTLSSPGLWYTGCPSRPS